MRLYPAVLPVLAALALFPPIAHSKPFDHHCVVRFTQLLKATGDQGVPPTPTRIELPASKKEAKASFRLALDAYEENVDQPALRELLKKVETSGVPLPAERAALKESRKWASILRSQYQFLAADGEAPAKFAKFTQVFGKLNDAIANEADPAEIGRLARETRKLLKLHPSAARMAEFTPASVKKLAGRSEEIRKAVVSLLGKDCTPHEFHETRKALKELLGYSQTRQALDPNAENLRAYEYLRYANDEMGKDNDEFVRLAAEGKMNYETDRLTLRPPVKAALRALEEALTAR